MWTPRLRRILRFSGLSFFCLAQDILNLNGQTRLCLCQIVYHTYKRVQNINWPNFI